MIGKDYPIRKEYRSYGSCDGAGFQTNPGPRLRLDDWERMLLKRRIEKGDEEAKQELAADVRLKAAEDAEDR